MAAETIPIAFVHDFQAEIHRLAAQRMTKLRGAVRVKTGVVGKDTTFNRLGPSELAPMNVRHGDTTYLNAQHSTRRAKPTDKGGALLLDKMDEWKVLIAPMNDYAMNLAESANRFYDDLIIAALGGGAIAVDENDAETSITLASWKSGTRAGGSSAGSMAGSSRPPDARRGQMDGQFTALVSRSSSNLFMGRVRHGAALHPRLPGRDGAAPGHRSRRRVDLQLLWIEQPAADRRLARPQNYFFEALDGPGDLGRHHHARRRLPMKNCPPGVVACQVARCESRKRAWWKSSSAKRPAKAAG